MATARRYLTFSLRTLFVVTTALAVWLGVIVNRAREQREAVEAIEALDGVVIYDWFKFRRGTGPVTEHEGPAGPAWLRRIIGDDYFQSVRAVNFGIDPNYGYSELNVQESIPHLMRLRRLDSLVIGQPGSIEIKKALKAALPRCSVFFNGC